MLTAGREISVCNFRDSGMLSNESTRYLRGLHERLSRELSHSLGLFLGSPLELKFDRMEQLDVNAFSDTLTDNHYLLPLGLAPLPERAVACVERGLLFQLLDLVMGGSGEVQGVEREITEIDEELFRCLMEVFCIQLESVWRGCEVSVAVSPSIKRAAFEKAFGTEERLLALRFTLHVGESLGAILLLLPATFAAALVQGGETEGAQGDGHAVAGRQIEGRLSVCRMKLTVDLCGNVVPLGELVALEKGSILDLGMPSGTPIQLRVNGYPIFEVMAMKEGKHKAAQVGRSLQDKEGV